MASELWASSSTSSSSPSPSSSSNWKLWRRGDSRDVVELLQLGGGDGEHAAAVPSPCPRASAMRAEKEPAGGRDLAPLSARSRESKGGHAAPQRPTAHIGPAKFKPAERRRGRALPAGAARAEPGQSGREQTPRCRGDAWTRRGFVRACRAWLPPPGPRRGPLLRPRSRFSGLQLAGRVPLPVDSLEGLPLVCYGAAVYFL